MLYPYLSIIPVFFFINTILRKFDVSCRPTWLCVACIVPDTLQGIVSGLITNLSCHICFYTSFIIVILHNRIQIIWCIKLSINPSISRECNISLHCWT